MVDAFFVKTKRSRYRAQLSSAKNRYKAIDRLAHCSDLNASAMTKIAESEQNPAAIEHLLVAAGAPSSCHVISENSRIDGDTMNLTDALNEVVGSGYGTLISCIPGVLGYYEGEEKHARFILQNGSI